MKKQIFAVITVIGCVALCAVVWQLSAEVEDLPAKPIINAVSAEFEARSEETPHIFISAETPAPETEPVAEIEPEATGITAEKETEKPASTQTVQAVKPAALSSEPHNGDVRVVDGEKQIYLLGFGWIKDEGGSSVGTMVGNPGDQLTGNKVGQMGATVGSKGDINKMVGVMGNGDAPANREPTSGTKKHIDGVLHIWVSGFGYVPHSGDNVVTYAEDMYEYGVKIGIMGGDDCPSGTPSASPAEQPEPTGVIYTEIQPPVMKVSTPSAYKPNGEPYTP